MVNNSDVLATIGALERVLRRAGYAFDAGAGLTAAEETIEQDMKPGG